MKQINEFANIIAKQVVTDTMIHIDEEDIDLLNTNIELRFIHRDGNLICEAILVVKVTKEEE